MDENNINKVNLEKKQLQTEKEKIQYVSFSEKDKEGKIHEAYGYFQPLTSGKTFEEELKEFGSKIKRR